MARPDDRITRIARRIFISYDENAQDYFMEAQKKADPAIAECIPAIAIRSVWIPGLTGGQLKSLADFLASLDASYAPCLEDGRIDTLMDAMAESKASLDVVQSPEILLKGTGCGGLEEFQEYYDFVKKNYQSSKTMQLLYSMGNETERRSIIRAGAVLPDDKYQEVLDGITHPGDILLTVGPKTQRKFKDMLVARFVDDFMALENGGLMLGWLDGQNGRNLRLMAASQDEHVRAYAAGNEKTPVAALKRLARDGSNLVRYRAGHNMSLPADIYVDYDSSGIPEKWQMH